MPTVVGLTFTPVKATRLHVVDRIELGPDGVRENRRFYVIDEHDRMINSKIVGELQTVVADYSHADRRLRLVATGRAGRRGRGPARRRGRHALLLRPAQGPSGRRPLVGGVQRRWPAAGCAWSSRAGRDEGVDRGADGAVSLISRASLARLAEVGGVETVDPRRFRMLVEIDGVDAHAEDRWVDGGSVRIGGAVVAFGGHVGRCLITSRDPDSGVVDLPTLDILGDYRGALDSTEPLPFGVWGRVLEPGTVRVGDEVTPPDG